MKQFNFAANAGWMQSLISAVDWHAMFPDRHQLFQNPWTFMSNHNCACDELHIVHLGTNQVLLGSVLWLLVHQLMPNDPVSNMTIVWAMIREQYQANAVTTQFSSLGLNSFHDPSRHRANYPRLKGKGMEIKEVLNPIMQIFKEFMRPGSWDDAKTLEMLEMMSDIQQMFDDHADSYFLPPDVANRVLDLGDGFLERWAVLHNRAATRHELLFHTLPKHHFFWHLCHRCQWEHPRLGNTCLDEDFVGRVKQIVMGSTAGLALHKIPAKVVGKFQWGKSFLYTHAFDL